jgi:7-cyano-7-deazaguanine synthase
VKKTTAAVLLSGGIDSAVASALAVERYGPRQVTLVICNYGQLAEAEEFTAATKISDHLGAKLEYLPCPLPDQPRSSITGAAGSLQGPDTIVAGRNAAMIEQASHFGTEVWIGAHAGDREVYADCRPEFFRLFPFPVVAPFVYLSKLDIYFIGARMQVPLWDTWSCYKPHSPGVSCDKCGACCERREAKDAFAMMIGGFPR